MGDINNKVALVTGGGSGIGQEICRDFAKSGVRVVVSDINVNAAKVTTNAIIKDGNEAIAIEHNVASLESWGSAVKTPQTHFDGLNILINNAGIFKDSDCEAIFVFGSYPDNPQ